MSQVVRVTRHIESELVHLPELHEFIGRDVEILVRALGPREAARSWDSLKGSVLRYGDPFEPIDVEDWEALQ